MNDTIRTALKASFKKWCNEGNNDLDFDSFYKHFSLVRADLIPEIENAENAFEMRVKPLLVSCREEIIRLKRYNKK